MTDPPKLELGDPPPGLVRRQHAQRGVWLLGLLQILTLAAVGWMLSSRLPQGEGTAGDLQRSEEFRATAIALEDRSLSAEAASAWREVLRLAPSADDRAAVLYRIGSLLMDAQDYSQAVTALIEAEQLVGDNDPIQAQVGPKIVECLRRLGRYGEVGRELSRQVEFGAGGTAQGKVLATFAGESFTEADLDRMIERSVDRLLAMQPGSPFPISRQEYLKQYESGDARQGMLQEMLQRELFSRRARELKIDREDAFLEMRDFVETQLLASQFLGRELEKIQPTDIDIESYFTANQAVYRQPETAEVVVLPLQDQQSSAEVLAEIQTAADFRSRADEANGEAEIAPQRIEAGQPHARLGDTSDLFELAAGEWTKTPITVGEEKFLVLVESKRPATTPQLAQIRFRVEADYRRRKQQELIQRLAAELMSRYDVKIVAAPAQRSGQESPAAAGPAQSATESAAESAAGEDVE